jgi:hypothetical protein
MVLPLEHLVNLPQPLCQLQGFTIVDRCGSDPTLGMSKRHVVAHSQGRKHACEVRERQRLTLDRSDHSDISHGGHCGLRGKIRSQAGQHGQET